MLYEFEEGGGAVVHDTSGSGTPTDLTVLDTGSVTWTAGGLSVDSSTNIETSAPAAKIIDACMSTNEITIEAWVRPVNATQSGPARIITLSLDPFERNFRLMQEGDEYHVRLRTTDTDVTRQ